MCAASAAFGAAPAVLRLGGDIPLCRCEFEAPHTVAIESIVKPRLAELTGGSLVVDYFPGTSGMGQKQLYERMLLGAWEGAVVTTAVLETYVPSIQLVSLPYLWKDFDHVHRALDGPVGKRLEGDAAKAGFRILGWWHFPPRDILCRDEIEARTPADLRGKKIRTMQSPVYVRTMKAYGAIPVPMDWGEVYMAMKQGVVDCQETSILPAYYMKHFEVTKTVVQLEEIYTILAFAVSEKWWASLPQAHRDALAQAVREATAAQRSADRRLYEKMKALWSEKGARFIRPDRAAFIAAARSIYPSFEPAVARELFEAVERAREP